MRFAPWLLRDPGAGEAAALTSLQSQYFRYQDRFRTGQCRGTAEGLHAQFLLSWCCRWEPTDQLPQSTRSLWQRKGRAA